MMERIVVIYETLGLFPGNFTHASMAEMAWWMATL